MERVLVRHVLIDEKNFKTNYHEWLHERICRKTEGDTGFYVLDYLVGKAWDFKCDVAQINVKEFAVYHEKTENSVRKNLYKMIDAGTLIPLNFEDECPELPKFQLPFVKDAQDLYKRFGLKF